MKKFAVRQRTKSEMDKQRKRRSNLGWSAQSGSSPALMARVRVFLGLLSGEGMGGGEADTGDDEPVGEPPPSSSDDCDDAVADSEGMATEEMRLEESEGEAGKPKGPEVEPLGAPGVGGCRLNLEGSFLRSASTSSLVTAHSDVM
jgi:hypothetical protein